METRDSPWLSFKFGEQNLESRLDGFDITFLRVDEKSGRLVFSLAIAFNIRDRDIENGNQIRITVEDNNNKDIFAEVIELIKPKLVIGVNFIQPGNEKPLRDPPIWLLPKVA